LVFGLKLPRETSTASQTIAFPLSTKTLRTQTPTPTFSAPTLRLRLEKLAHASAAGKRKPLKPLKQLKPRPPPQARLACEFKFKPRCFWLR
jgi:hypothetical protein